MTATGRMSPTDRVFVAGHRGMVGSAVCRALAARAYPHVLTRGRDELDLTRQAAVDAFFEAERPDVVVLAAARVGGIVANDTYRWDFIRDNLLIQTHVLDAALRTGVRRLAFLGSTCIYPRLAPQPMPESSLLTGPLEPTNEPYAVAKIAGVKMVESANRQHGTRWVSLMPTNLYGPNDNFDLETSHVLPALIRRFDEARCDGRDTVTLWGTGTPRREFLHVDDLADAVCFVLEATDATGLINVGVGEDLSIADLAGLVAECVGYTGRIAWDTTRPDGTPRKLVDVTRLTALGWTARTSLRDGIAATVEAWRASAGR